MIFSMIIVYYLCSWDYLYVYIYTMQGRNITYTCICIYNINNHTHSDLTYVNSRRLYIPSWLRFLPSCWPWCVYLHCTHQQTLQTGVCRPPQEPVVNRLPAHKQVRPWHTHTQASWRRELQGQRDFVFEQDIYYSKFSKLWEAATWVPR